MDNARGTWGYRSYREHLAERFPGLRVRKLCLNAGFTCPNIDGRIAKGGCLYCNNHGFVPSLAGEADLCAQWDRGRRFLRQRHGRVDAFIAYFQAFSNTYGEPGHLRSIFGAALSFPENCGLSISTRPDCLSDEVVLLLAELAQRGFVTLELGLQSDRDEVLAGINRGHGVQSFLSAVARSAGRGFELCAHFILGLPGEGADAPERMGRLAASLPLNSVKIHNLHVMRHTQLAELYHRGEFTLVPRAAYLSAAARFIRELRPDQAVQRLIADAPDSILEDGPWCHDKQGFLAEMKEALEEGQKPG